MKRGLFPGSFDPFTKGHEVVITKALSLFDEIVIGVGINNTKNYLFDTEKRLNHIRALFKDEPKVRVEAYNKLTVDFCKDIDAQFIIRGLRDSKDYEYERSIAHMNKSISNIETVIFLTDPEFSAISSTIIREIHRNGAPIEKFVTLPNLLV
jgi:pantetheine-phosphate adenylyltransferase